MIRVHFTILLLLGVVVPAWACGPVFPTMYAVRDLANTVLTMPYGSFSYELLQLTGTSAPPRYPPGIPASEREADELCEALGDTEHRGAALDAYQLLRTAKIPPILDDASPLRWVPTEFLFYAEGAVHYHQQQWAEALAAWKQLLDLPPGQRHYRSTWAAYMCGEVYRKLLLESGEEPTGPADPTGEAGEAIAWYRRTRELAADGFADSLDLAWSSLGQQARIAFLSEEYLTALHGYLAQYQAPASQTDHTVEQSLRMTAAQMLNQPAAQLAAYAANPKAAPVLTAYLLTTRKHSDSDRRTAWMTAVANADLLSSPRHASRLAWLAYYQGDIQLARRLLSAEDQLDAMARWLQAKLSLWDGDTDHAILILESLAALNGETLGYPGTSLCGAWWSSSFQRPYIDGELGLLYLAREEYDSALVCFLRGALWNDAAYVAEQVMTTEELEQFATRRLPRNVLEEPIRTTRSYWYYNAAQDNHEQRLAYLLARRWMRIGKRDRALKWYPEPHHTSALKLDHWLSKAEDPDRSGEERAEAKVKAARIIREQGMELLGTELDHYGGVYLKNKYPQEADRFYKALVNRCRKLPIGQEADRRRWFPAEFARSEP